MGRDGGTGGTSPCRAVQLSLRDRAKKCRVGAGERVVRARTFWNAMRAVSLPLPLEVERSAARTGWNALASLRSVAISWAGGRGRGHGRGRGR